MCPHGAANSVLASAYFQRLAKERGLNVHVASAGTEPDATVSPVVAAHLKGRGYSVPIAKPRKVAPEEFASADVVISIGCDLAALPQPRGRLVRWDEVPALSDGFTAADEAIHKRVNDLVEELVRSMPKTKWFRRPNAGTVTGGMTWVPVVGGSLAYASPRRFSRAMAP
jgi:protein-tyrosine-phosphatase